MKKRNSRNGFRFKQITSYIMDALIVMTYAIYCVKLVLIFTKGGAQLLMLVCLTSLYLQIRQLAQEIRELAVSRPVTIFNGDSSSNGTEICIISSNCCNMQIQFCLLFFIPSFCNIQDCVYEDCEQNLTLPSREKFKIFIIIIIPRVIKKKKKSKGLQIQALFG